MNKYAAMARPVTSESAKVILGTSRSEEKLRCSTERVRPFDCGVPEFSVSPRGSAISGISYNENIVVGRKYDRMNRFPRGSMHLPISAVGPMYRDFDRIIRNLDLVTSGIDERRGILSEESSAELFLEKGLFHYFTIPLYSKSCPLRVAVEKTKGKIRIFVSGTVMNPCEWQCDKECTRDRFTYRENGKKFLSQSLYVGIQAIEATKLSISAKFGPLQLFKAAVSKPFNIALSDFEYDRFPIKTDRLRYSLQKDFIKDNIKNLPLSSMTQADFYKKKGIEWNNRRQRAVHKRNQLRRIRKERTVSILNRQRRREQETEKRITAENTQNTQKLWIQLITEVSMLKSLQNIRDKAREETVKQLRKSSSIMKIQKVYRNRSPLNSDLFRARNLLLFYCSTGVPTGNSQVRFRLFTFIEASAQTTALTVLLAATQSRVIGLQRAWRRAFQSSKERYRLLIAYWNKTLAKILSVSERPKSIRTGRKRPLKNTQFFMVNALDRNKILNEHLLTAKLKHRDELRHYLESKEYLSRRVTQAFYPSTQHQDIVERGVPRFEYFPSEEHMIRMIEKASKGPIT